MAIVDIRNLCKVYDLGAFEVTALRELDLQIEQGEYMAIMGPSGSGKSTLLNLLGCLDTPSSGDYDLAGEDISSLDDDELSAIRGSRIGFIFQSYNLIAQLNVIENIEVPIYYQGINERQSYVRAKELAELVGLGDRLKHRPSQLSGGQQQRVAIARAIVPEPAIVLADEPTANVDSATAHDLLDLMEELNINKGITFLFSTHDERVMSRARRLIQLQDGKLAADETRR